MIFHFFIVCFEIFNFCSALLPVTLIATFLHVFWDVFKDALISCGTVKLLLYFASPKIEIRAVISTSDHVLPRFIVVVSTYAFAILLAKRIQLLTHNALVHKPLSNRVQTTSWRLSNPVRDAWALFWPFGAGIYKVGGRNPAAITSGDDSDNRSRMCECCRLVPPPMVIWDPKTLSPELCDGEVPGTVYWLSDRGWIDKKLFNVLFSNHFFAYATCTRPLLHLLDWHSSHCCPETVRLATADRLFNTSKHNAFNTTFG